MFRERFPFFKQKKKAVYFDSASSTQKLDSFLEKQDYYSKVYSNVHRSSCILSSELTEEFEKSREKIAKTLNVKANEVCFVPSATFGLNLLAFSLNKRKILTTSVEHNSNLLPWIENNHVLNVIRSNGLLDYSQINSKAQKNDLVSITHASNVTGEVLDLKKLDFLDEIPLILDSCQYASHAIPDYYKVSAGVFSFHKIFGGNIGILFVREDFQKELKKRFAGGGTVSSINFGNNSLRPEFLDFPIGFEPGTQNIPAIIASPYSFEFLKSNQKRIHNHNISLKKKFLNSLKEFDAVSIKSVESGLPIISFEVKGIHSHDLSFLMGEKGFCFRSGDHCAQLLAKELKSNSLNRISLHCYNSYDEIDSFFNEFSKVLNKLGV
ncbi:Cysteine desulfurase [uncultured archaeon]|nr:Cysteine desulfurase [uncultured archaeon]